MRKADRSKVLDFPGRGCASDQPMFLSRDSDEVQTFGLKAFGVWRSEFHSMLPCVPLVHRQERCHSTIRIFRLDGSRESVAGLGASKGSTCVASRFATVAMLNNVFLIKKVAFLLLYHFLRI